MSLLTGPGRNSEMSVMMSSKVSIPDLPTSSRWPGDSIWKTPRVLAAEIMSKVRSVVEGHLHLVVEVDVAALDPLDLRDRVGHRGLHPDAEHVELEQAEVLDVLLVELAHRVAQEALLHRGAVEQGARRRAARRTGASRCGAAARRGSPPAGRTGRSCPTRRRPPRGPGRWRAARAGRAAPSGRRGRGCAGTPWRWRRSPPPACRARPRRRGSRGAPCRCPSSRRVAQRSSP